ncbi:GTA baseplate fiber-binding domain-containing protein [Mesorhizobium neociceri]|uniref:Tip attachment protein J domain-containing protein n=1 Tax=Mesorhizobium neociceri TaxID=1307853 RepID=A0A838B6J5_9HYPH|nr:phage tail protein [Mesorhizobium neociceri]MBA1141763.1 hypothetical protein [Mesorhizobium neociceri]
MAFIAPLAGAAVGGGLLGSIVSTAVGVGINLAIAYFFPQKIKGPRAESLKAQTSRYGEQLTRWHGAIRTAGAVIWLKGDKVDEHVKKERQGKALGPEVTTYSYTATFAVALAWNGPASGITRIWADDKLIFNVSFEALQDAIAHGGKGIGVAKGASITLYLGTDTQEPDPDIEADRGAGQVPAWPGIVYAVIKNLPLDEFGIRVPNIEAEITKSQNMATASVTPTGAGNNPWNTDCSGEYYANAAGTTLYIEKLPAATPIATNTLPHDAFCVHITDLNKVVVSYLNFSGVRIFDAATGAFEADIAGVGPSSPDTNCCMDDISFGGVNYLFVYNQAFNTISCLSNAGLGYSAVWQQPLAGARSTRTLSASPSRLYAVDDWVFTGGSKIITVIDWDTAAPVLSTVTLSALSANARACFYDEESDSVIIEDFNGSVYVYTPDLVSLLRSKVNSLSLSYSDPMLSKRMKVSSDQIAIKQQSDSGKNDVFIYRVSDLSEAQHIVASTTAWDNKTATDYYYAGFNERWQVMFVADGLAGITLRLWYLPRAAIEPIPVADAIAAECRFAGVTADVSAVTAMMYGYGDRAGTPPRGVIEDITRVNFIDFAQIDGVQTFFPRETASFRTLSIDEVGVALNAEPDPISIIEEYPSALDMPEQVIITYPSYDAVYRIGAQAGTTDEDQKFSDEPSQADETGAPIKVRRKRTLEFSTAQVLTDDDAAKVADVMYNSLTDAATIYKTTLPPKHMDLHPGLVVTLPLDEERTAKAVLTKMSGDTVIEVEFRKRGDSFSSEAVGQPTPYIIDSLLGPADATPVLIDGHLLRSADDNDGFYAGVAVISDGSFRSASIYRSEDGGTTYAPWAGFENGMIRGIALDALPDRPHPGAWDRATVFNIAVPIGTAPDSVSEEVLLGSETTNGFAVFNASLGDWEYIRAASVVDNMNGTWTLSTLLRGLKGTEFAMVGHTAGATVYHLDDQAMTRSLEGDRTLSRVYVAVPTSTVFDSTGAVTFTNYGKGLRPWSPQLASAVLDAGTGDWILTWRRRDRIGQAWPESGPEDPPMSETTEAYVVNIYDGMGVLVNSYDATTGAYTYTAADQTSDFGSPQTSLEFGVAQVSAIYGDGIELREAA